jgi:tetratricopeptide (TPR) repeat protein
MKKVVRKLLGNFQRFMRNRIIGCLLAVSTLMLMMPGLAFADAYQIGLKLYAQGDYAMASRYFLEAAGQHTDNPNAHYYLADSYLKLNRLAEAQAEYQKILAIAPDTQAARLSRIGLSHLRDYLSTSQTERWQNAGGTGSGDAIDKYMGGPINGEDYLKDVTEGGRLVRWSLSKMPLKIYIEQAPQGIHNFQPAFASQVRRAFDVWTGALNHQLAYTLVTIPDQADIRVHWTDTIDTRGHSGDGGTAYTAGLMIPHIHNDQIEYMEVNIATFDIQGHPQNGETIYAVAIHELGHSLGLLGHSDNPNDIMYAENQHVINPSKRDLNTIRRLYSAVADINNLPADTRPKDPKRQAELAANLDATIAKMEVQAKQDGMALSWLNLGVNYFQKAKEVTRAGGTDAKDWYQKALSATNQAIQMEPKDPRAYHKRSLVYQELGNYDSALQDIQHAITLDHKQPEYYKLQAWYFAKLGQAGQACSSLDTYLLYQPNKANSDEVKQIQDQLTASKKGGN